MVQVELNWNSSSVELFTVKDKTEAKAKIAALEAAKKRHNTNMLKVNWVKQLEYFYPDGTKIEENDIVFYSESECGSHYADSIGLVIKGDIDFRFKTFVITMDEANTFEDYNEPDENTVYLKHGLSFLFSRGEVTTLRHFRKIGKYPENQEMLTADYANTHFSQR